jgi:hypothetical protein
MCTHFKKDDYIKINNKFESLQINIKQIQDKIKEQTNFLKRLTIFYGQKIKFPRAYLLLYLRNANKIETKYFTSVPRGTLSAH